LIRLGLILILSLVAEGAWSKSIVISPSNSVVCQLIQQKVQGQKPSESLAHNVAELIDQIGMKKVKIDLDGLLCITEITDQLDDYDMDVRLRSSLLGYSEEFKNTLWPQVLRKLKGKQKMHIEKILREAARLNEEGNG
jgi:hypothetical protein